MKTSRKQIIFAFAALAAVVVIAFAIHGIVGQRSASSTPSATQPAPQSPLHDAAEPKTPVVDVDEFGKSPGKYTGRITLHGVVQQVAPEKSLYVLISEKEFAACGLNECAEVEIPVHYKGESPDPGQALSITGKLNATDDQKRFFEEETRETASEDDPPVNNEKE